MWVGMYQIPYDSSSAPAPAPRRLRSLMVMGVGALVAVMRLVR